MMRLSLLSALLLTGLATCSLSSLAWALEPPAQLQWQTQAQLPALGSSEAKSGGRITLAIPSFPLTLRQVGPDSNHFFRKFLDENDRALIGLEPNSGTWMPELATAWAIAADGQTIYFRLDPQARWSDGERLKASDFVFTLNFMRSPHIKAPWYNDYYTKTIDDVTSLREASGREVVAVRLHDKSPDPLFYANIKPLPQHFYGALDPNFISTFNWKIAPTLGPYVLAQVDKGKRLVFKKQADWWARALPVNRHRFNVDEVVIKVVRDAPLMLEYLKRGEIDVLTPISSEMWQALDSDESFKKGYLQRLQFYYDSPRSDYGLILNQAYPPFRSREVREAFQYAMNVDRVIQELLKGEYQRLQGISRGYGPYTNPAIKARSFDIKRAGELLDAAGWSQRNAEGIRTRGQEILQPTVLYGSATLTPRLAVLAEEARKVGIDLRLQLQDDASTFQSYLDKKHDIAVMIWSSAFRPEYRSRLHSSLAFKPQTSNFSNTADPALDLLIEEYEHARDESIRIAKAHAIQQFVHDDAAFVPLFEVPYFRMAYAPWLRFPLPPGAKTTDSLYLFDAGEGGLVWVDEASKKATHLARQRGLKGEAKTWIETSFRVVPSAK